MSGKLPFLGSNIRQLRRKRGLTQSELAQKVGLKRNNIASYEAGTVEPKAASVLRLARYFGIEPVPLITTDLTEFIEQTDDDQHRSLDHMPEVMQTFVRRTADMEKILHGFREFYKFRMRARAENSPELQSLAHNFEDLMDIMDSMLRTNKELIGNEEDEE